MAGKRAHGAVVDEPEEEGFVAGQTPTKKVRLNVAEEGRTEHHAQLTVAAHEAAQGVVTPAGAKVAPRPETEQADNENARRELFPDTVDAKPAAVTPARLIKDEPESPVKRKLIFGRLVTEITVQDNVRQVYAIIRKLTGSIGGNGSHGPIYGELTMGSMQKMINLMKEHTGFDSTSRFIDVGSGIGKPNLHVAQDPGVEISYGIEVEADRWLLGMNCLKGVLDAAYEQAAGVSEKQRIRHHCFFEHGDIRDAKVFDPFTHVYMFSIGFPPTLWVDLAEIWNRSSSPYMICFHGPKDIIQSYEFQVELVAQTSTSMHGSKEGHMGYIYRRSPMKQMPRESCEPAFTNAFREVNSGLDSLRAHVDEALGEKMSSGPATRARRRGSSR